MRRIRWRPRKPNPLNRVRFLAAIGAIIMVGLLPETQQLGRDLFLTARQETGRIKAAIEMHEASRNVSQTENKQ